MAASTTSSLSGNTSYDSFFGEDLSAICFDLDVQQVVDNNNSSSCRNASLSNSSCCSLCRMDDACDTAVPAVSEESEAGDDEESTSAHHDAPLGSSGSVATTHDDRPYVPIAAVAPSRVVQTPSGAIACGCCIGSNMPSSVSCVQCEEVFQLPKSISIPKSASLLIDASPNCRNKKVFSSIVSATARRKGDDYLSSENSLPGDALCHLIKFLDVASLVQLRRCNKKLYSAASKNSAGWTEHCTSLWQRKANVCSAARQLLAKTYNNNDYNEYAAMEAYKLSIDDAARRHEILPDEICFDTTSSVNKQGIIWSFRFKESAGRDWTSWDPWWNHQDARKLAFLRDGTVMQVYPQGILPSIKSHNGIPLYEVFSERTIQRDGMSIPAPRIEMKWRFVNRPLDQLARPGGAFIRITVGGRDVPTYVVRRSPTGNWGFNLESCWGVYASYELPPKEGPSTTHVPQRRLRRTRTGSRWVDVEESDEEGEQERTRNVRRRLIDDQFDGQSQWREALLYNIGAVTLPEGNEDSTQEFDRAWQEALMMR